MVRGAGMAVTAVALRYQWAETTRIALGRGATEAPKARHAAVYRLSSRVFMGLPWPMNAAGTRSGRIGQRYHHRHVDFDQTARRARAKNGPMQPAGTGGTAMYKHILIPTDGSELSEKAVKEGIELAMTMKARVTVFTASPPFHTFATEAAIGVESSALYTATAEERAAARLKPGLEYAHAKGVAARTQHVFAERPYEAIIAAAAKEGCDLVCMASHGRKGIAGLLVGSETNKVLTHSKVPVL